MPLLRLLEEGHMVSGYFYNPNIHPLAEYLRRREGAAEVAARCGIKMIWALAPEDYSPPEWISLAAGLKGRTGKERCAWCLELRLRRTRALARSEGFDAFSSSLLYSRYQPHELIAAKGEEAARASGEETEPLSGGDPFFYYRDFRADWRKGVNMSKAWGIYRQQYCGCIFSEYERYAAELRESNARLTSSFFP
jgi:predicted adenine nucleotide alpha hydrolase (AANH) superfamily ATPase